MVMRHDPIDPGSAPGIERPVSPRAGPWVQDCMSRPATIGRDEPLAHAARVMEARRLGHLVVVDRGERFLGLVTAADVRAALASEPARVVGAVATRDVVCVPPYCGLAEAVRLMRDHQLPALAVVQSGRVVGILTDADLSSALVAQLERRARCA